MLEMLLERCEEATRQSEGNSGTLAANASGRSHSTPSSSSNHSSASASPGAGAVPVSRPSGNGDSAGFEQQLIAFVQRMQREQKNLFTGSKELDQLVCFFFCPFFCSEYRKRRGDETRNRGICICCRCWLRRWSSRCRCCGCIWWSSRR